MGREIIIGQSLWKSQENSDLSIENFNIKFNNGLDGADNQGEEAYIQDGKVYLAVTDKIFATKEAAEAFLNGASTTLYFLNNKGWEKVYAAINDGSKPGTEAEAAAELGDNWYQVSVPQNALVDSFTVIFNDGGTNETAKIDITDYTNNYITGNGELFSSQNAAESSAGIMNETVMYFLNSKDWKTVNAYVYGTAGEALGG